MRSSRCGSACAAVLLLAALLPAAAAYGADPVDLDAKARRLYDAGDYAAAAALWSKAYDARPDSAILVSLSSCLYKLGDREAALAKVETFLERSDAASDPDAYFRAKERATEWHLEAGRTAAEHGDCRRGLGHFDRAYALTGSAEALVEAGGCLERLGRKTEASVKYRTALAPGADLRAETRDRARARLAALDRAPAAAPAHKRFPWLAVGLASGAVVAGLLLVVNLVAWPRPHPDFGATTLGDFEVRF